MNIRTAVLGICALASLATADRKRPAPKLPPKVDKTEHKAEEPPAPAPVPPAPEKPVLSFTPGREGAGQLTLASGAPDSGPPPPDKRRMVGILDVRVDGVSDEIKLAFERGLEDQLDTKVYWLSSRAQMRDRMKFSTRWTEGCLVGACLAELRTQTSAELVVLAALNGSGTSFGHVVTIVRTDNGRVLSQEAGRCEVCTVQEAMTEATLSTMRLLNAVPDKLPDEAGDQSVAMDLVTTASKQRIADVHRGVRRRGIALTLIGLAVTGGGIATYVLTDRPDYAVAAMAAGGGLLLGGVVVLTF